MSKRIVDTNVIIIANNDPDSDNKMSLKCTGKCIALLRRIKEQGILVVDRNDEIRKEYQKKLRNGRSDKVGAQFLVWFWTNHTNPQYVDKSYSITRSRDFEDWFDEIPRGIGLEKFDRSDRKFLALAFGHPEHPPIVNASDTDWLEIEEIIESQGITIEYISRSELEEIADRKKSQR